VVGHAQNVSDLSSLSTWIAEQFDQRLDWKEVGWVKSRFGGPVIVKGILDPSDARLAVEAGADAIIVSNHGGRQLDGAPSSIRVLPEIVDAVGDKTEVLMDGGIRSGQDVLKALALGAKGTFIGRPILYGLGAGGEAGVTRAFEIIRREADITMALLGERDVKNIGPHNIYSNELVRRQGY
jgi:L-lactate dehydrogenase (cytochrome)